MYDVYGNDRRRAAARAVWKNLWKCSLSLIQLCGPDSPTRKSESGVGHSYLEQRVQHAERQTALPNGNQGGGIVPSCQLCRLSNIANHS